MVALKGEFELLNASWSLGNGRQVQFRMVEDEQHDRVHPFKHYTKRRKDRVGSRFFVVVVEQDHGEVIYEDEMMLAAWADGEKGQTVTFWIDEHADRHPFAGYKKREGSAIGSMFTLVFVELGDDEAPIDQEKREKLEGAVKQGRKLSQQAHLMVTTEQFVQYAREKSGYNPREGWSPDLARRWVKYKIKIESFGDLDRNESAAKRFEDEIRKPYVKWGGVE